MRVRTKYMNSSCSKSWGFWVLVLDFFHFRRAFTALSTVSRLTLEVVNNGGVGWGLSVAMRDRERERERGLCILKYQNIALS